MITLLSVSRITYELVPCMYMMVLSCEPHIYLLKPYCRLSSIYFSFLKSFETPLKKKERDTNSIFAVVDVVVYSVADL